ncbi:MAG: prepilin-type N-terminal cleavage/methylation domain-containing protein, partial [Capsulimonadales bacterium]|nr:prepilin-type N-terminal cleavage/methylation domain-containing protein [Capsulimonadales bacterium]
MNRFSRDPRRRFRAGLTLIELMITVVLMVFVSAAVATAFSAGLEIERRRNTGREERERTLRMERRLTRLLQGAFV